MFIKTLESKVKPSQMLRIGLGLVFLYAALFAWVQPEAWVGFVPTWLAKIVERHMFLSVYSIFELVLAALFLVNKWVKWAAFLAFLNYLGVIIFYGVDFVTFRDLGLLLATLALFILTDEENRKTA